MEAVQKNSGTARLLYSLYRDKNRDKNNYYENCGSCSYREYHNLKIELDLVNLGFITNFDEI